MALVLVLLGVVFIAVQLNMTGVLMEARLESSARGIAEVISTAMSHATHTGKTYHLVYDTENQRVYIFSPEENEENQENYRSLSVESARGDSGDLEQATTNMSVIMAERYLEGGVKFKDIQMGEEKWEDPGLIRLEVTPLGVSADHIVHLIDGDERELSLEFDSITGTVKFHNGYREYELEDADENVLPGGGR